MVRFRIQFSLQFSSIVSLCICFRFSFTFGFGFGFGFGFRFGISLYNGCEFTSYSRYVLGFSFNFDFGFDVGFGFRPRRGFRKPVTNVSESLFPMCFHVFYTQGTNESGSPFSEYL